LTNAEKFDLSRSLKVIGTDTNRSANYNFLLVFHSNWPISYRFRYKGPQMPIFHTPHVYNASAENSFRIL